MSRRKVHENQEFWLDTEEVLFAKRRWEGTAREVDSIASLIELQSGAHDLDLCCRPGSHSLELVRRGHRVMGVDSPFGRMGAIGCAGNCTGIFGAAGPSRRSTLGRIITPSHQSRLERDLIVPAVAEHCTAPNRCTDSQLAPAFFHDMSMHAMSGNH